MNSPRNIINTILGLVILTSSASINAMNPAAAAGETKNSKSHRAIDIKSIIKTIIENPEHLSMLSPWLQELLLAGHSIDTPLPSANTSALILATTLHNNGAVRILLENKANPLLNDRGHTSALEAAARSGNNNAIQQFLDKQFNVNTKLDHNWTMLLAAVSEDKQATVKFLIKKGADLTAINGNGDTVLHLAKNREMALILLNSLNEQQKEQVINYINTSNKTPLTMAREKNDIERVGLLIMRGAVTNTQLDIVPTHHEHQEEVVADNNSAHAQHLGEPFLPHPRLVLSAMMHDPEFLEKLDAQPVIPFINTKNDADLTPLMEAAQRNLPDAVVFFLKRGADADLISPSDSGVPSSALTHALDRDHQDIVDILLPHCTYPKHIFGALAHTQDETLKNKLREHYRKIFPKTQTFKGISATDAIHIFINAPDAHTAKKYINEGFTIESRDETDQTALMHAVHMNREDLVRVLLNRRSKLLAQKELEALELAHRNKNTSIISLFHAYNIKMPEGFCVNPDCTNGYLTEICLCREVIACPDCQSKLWQEHHDTCPFKNAELPEVSPAQQPDIRSKITKLLDNAKKLDEFFTDASHLSAINTQSEFRGTPLMEACDRNKPDAVRCLLKHKADPAIQKNSNGHTALHLAILRSHDDIVTLLCEEDLRLSKINGPAYQSLLTIKEQKLQDSPLETALYSGKISILTTLLNHQKAISLQLTDDYMGQLLNQAIAIKSPEPLAALLTAGFPADTFLDASQATALSIATFQGQHEHMKLLLEHGASADHKETKENDTALSIAVKENDEQGVLLLLKHCSVQTIDHACNIATQKKLENIALILDVERKHRHSQEAETLRQQKKSKQSTHTRNNQATSAKQETHDAHPETKEDDTQSTGAGATPKNSQARDNRDNQPVPTPAPASPKKPEPPVMHNPQAEALEKTRKANSQRLVNALKEYQQGHIKLHDLRTARESYDLYGEDKTTYESELEQALQTTNMQSHKSRNRSAATHTGKNPKPTQQPKPTKHAPHGSGRARAQLAQQHHAQQASLQRFGQQPPSQQLPKPDRLESLESYAQRCGESVGELESTHDAYDTHDVPSATATALPTPPSRAPLHAADDVRMSAPAASQATTIVRIGDENVTVDLQHICAINRGNKGFHLDTNQKQEQAPQRNPHEPQVITLARLDQNTFDIENNGCYHLRITRNDEPLGENNPKLSSFFPCTWTAEDLKEHLEYAVQQPDTLFFYSEGRATVFFGVMEEHREGKPLFNAPVHCKGVIEQRRIKGKKRKVITTLYPITRAQYTQERQKWAQPGHESAAAQQPDQELQQALALSLQNPDAIPSSVAAATVDT